MAKQKPGTSEEYTVTLRGCSERWTVTANDEADAIAQVKKNTGSKRDARNFTGRPTRTLNFSAPAIQVPPNDQPATS